MPSSNDHSSQSLKSRIAVFRKLTQSLRERIEQALTQLESSLQQVSLLAARHLLQGIENILSQWNTPKTTFFIHGFSEALNVQLIEQIFHLYENARFEDFILRQLFVLNPETLKPLPIESRNELHANWSERLESAEQAILIGHTGVGLMRGLSPSEQQMFFEALTNGTIQPKVFPEEVTILLKTELDQKLASFRILLNQYNTLAHLPPAPILSVSREQQRFEKLIAIYLSPQFLVYQYYRCLLDYLDDARYSKHINLFDKARNNTEQKTSQQTGDKDLDKLLGHSKHVFVRWPTGDDPVYGQEQYLQHFMTQTSFDHIKKVEGLTIETPLLVFAFDVSGSMLANDVEPSRFEYALDLQETLVSQINKKVALAQVVFSSMGVVSQIFGQTKEAFLDLLIDSRIWYHQARNTLLQDMFGYTSLGAGLLSAASLIEQTRQTVSPWGTPPQAEILLLTDGDHNCPPNFYQAAKYCKERNIAVHSICCAREVCVEVETDHGTLVKTLQELVSQEAQERADKWKSWYHDTPFHQVLKRQHEIVLNQYRHRLQQNLQRSTGANVEALETISELTGGHFFPGALGERGPATVDSVLHILNLRSHLREQIISLKKKKSQPELSRDT